MTKKKMKRQILISVLIAVGINPLYAESPRGPGLGHAISPEEIAAWDISVFPDGEGLPKGEGNVKDGEVIYKSKCIACHGENGLGTATGDQLAGAQMGLTSEYPEQTIGSYWPYATTVFDVVRRSMPMTAPGSLTNDETYAVTAYLLYLNNLINNDAVMNNETLPKVKMPNEAGFIDVYKTEESK
jgi:S-disulfanyl-L-cysteine oxidoreductase SoxD